MGKGIYQERMGRGMARGMNMVKYKMSLNENTFITHHVDNG